MLQAFLWHYELFPLLKSVMFICLPYQWPAWTDLFINTYLVHTLLMSDGFFSLILFRCFCELVDHVATYKTCSIFAGLSLTWTSVWQKMIGNAIRKVRNAHKAVLYFFLIPFFLKKKKWFIYSSTIAQNSELFWGVYATHNNTLLIHFQIFFVLFFCNAVLVKCLTYYL